MLKYTFGIDLRTHYESFVKYKNEISSEYFFLVQHMVCKCNCHVLFIYKDWFQYFLYFAYLSKIRDRKNKLCVTFLVCHCINQLMLMQVYIPLRHVLTRNNDKHLLNISQKRASFSFKIQCSPLMGQIILDIPVRLN